MGNKEKKNKSELNKSSNTKVAIKYSVMGVVSAAAVAGVVAGAMYISDPNEYTLTYIVDGKVVEVNVEEDALLSSIPAPSVTGYSFDGWYVDPTYTTMLTPGYKFNGDIELYPKFTPNKYTITYHSNNGVGGIFTQEVYFNSEYTTIANTFAKPNYTFIGWSTDINARYDSSNIIPSAQVTLLDTEGITLYAVWKGVDQNVTFDTTDLIVNGAAYTISPITVPHGDSYVLPVIEGNITNGSYNTLKFAGYNINGNIYQPGSTIVITDNINISINWQSASSVLNFNVQSPNGESISNISPVICYDEDTSYSYTNLPAPDLATNYEFVGWNTKSDGTGDTYLVGETFTTTEATSVLYAIWQGKQRTLNIYNAGTVVEVITCRYGDSITLPTYTLDKHTFLGFNSASNYTGTTYSGTINILFTDEIVNLYAEYSRNKITVSFNPNGGVGSIDNITINSEELYTFDSNEIAAQRESITRRYYTLAGWSTNQNAEPNTASFDISAGSTNLPLYAIWSRNQVQVTYAPNMDSVVPVAYKIDQGTDYTFTETGFQKPGYYIVEFKVNGTSYKVGDTLQSVEVDNLQIEVVWKKIEKVLFKNAGNISTVDTVSGDTVSVEDVSIGAKIIAPYVAVENSYKTNANGERVYFAGWATTENATKPTVFAKSTEITITESQQIYYAVYMEASTCLNYTYNATNNNYTVSLNESVFDISVEDNYTLIVPNIYNGKTVVEFENVEPLIENAYNSWYDDGENGGLAIKNAIIAEGITTVGYHALAFNTQLRNVTLPNTVTTIGDDAFDGCTNLTVLNLPESVTDIGSFAFAYSGIKSMVIPTDITVINTAVFSNSALENIVLHDGITEISDDAFYNTNIRKIVIPNSVVNFGDSVFMSSSLKEVTLPENIQVITQDMFSDCYNLTAITLPDTVNAIRDGAFEGCRSLETINIPSGVTTIGDYAFVDTKISEITIPSSLTSLGYTAFNWCESLTTLTINTNKVLTYSDDFDGCPITTVTYGEGVTSVPDSAWAYCKTLQTINLPSTLVSIGAEAFKSTKLTEVIVPEGVTTIDTFAFSYTTLTTISLPSTLTSISDFLFSGCGNLTEIVIPEGVTTIGRSAFSTTGLTEIVIPEGVTTIGSGAFLRCSHLTKIVIHEGVTSIGNQAFYFCYRLTTVTLPSTLTSIGNEAFWNCYNLTEIVIPEGVTTIGDSAFGECTRLTTVTINSNNISYVDFEWVDDDDGYSEETYYYCPITTVTYGEGVTSIPDNAWAGCTTLKSIIIPSTVTSVGDNAFANCSGLTDITINTNVAITHYDHFDGSDSIATITYGEGVTTVPYNAWADCKSLTSVMLPSSLTTIGGYSFSYCDSLQSITIPSGVTSIGTYAFEDGISLTSVTINTNMAMTYANHFSGCQITTVTYGEGVTSIPDNAWEGCQTLEKLYITSDIVISADAFSNNVKLPDKVYIGGTEVASWWTETTNYFSGAEIYVDSSLVQTYKDIRPQDADRVKEYN